MFRLSGCFLLAGVQGNVSHALIMVMLDIMDFNDVATCYHTYTEFIYLQTLVHRAPKLLLSSRSPSEIREEFAAEVRNRVSYWAGRSTDETYSKVKRTRSPLG